MLKGEILRTLRQLREKKGLSRNALGVLSGVNPRSIETYESGGATQLANLIAISESMGLEIVVRRIGG